MLGLLRPLLRLSKSKGPPEKLRTIILLSALKRLLTICMIERTFDHLKTYISVAQTANQSARGTTEQVSGMRLFDFL